MAHGYPRPLPLYPQDPNLKVTRGYLVKNEAMALARPRRYDESEAALNRTLCYWSPRLIS